MWVLSQFELCWNINNELNIRALEYNRELDRFVPCEFRMLCCHWQHVVMDYVIRLLVAIVFVVIRHIEQLIFDLKIKRKKWRRKNESRQWTKSKIVTVMCLNYKLLIITRFWSENQLLLLLSINIILWENIFMRSKR